VGIVEGRNQKENRIKELLCCVKGFAKGIKLGVLFVYVFQLVSENINDKIEHTFTPILVCLFVPEIVYSVCSGIRLS